jgi:hypothetical protein
VSPPNPIRPKLLAAALVAGVLAGCHDASSDPLAVLLTEETRSVLAADANLPSLSRLVSEAPGDDRVAGAVERWSLSWDLDVEEGRALRSRANTEAASPLAESLGSAAVARSVRAVGETLEATAALETGALTEAIAGNLLEAKAHHDRAVAALTAGADAEALEGALHASDLIREVGPESVSRMLLARAESQLEAALAAGQGPPGGQVDLQRGQRLIRGAQLALEEGDYVRAIQRAFYACQVLGLEVS